jgi:hypothetical protein
VLIFLIRKLDRLAVPRYILLNLSNSTKVYILGAGCSACGHYPLASEVATGLNKFAGDRLSHESAAKLRDCVEQTCCLLTERRLQTIDELAKALRDVNPDSIRKAKIAMSVFFFGIEEEAVGLATPNYAAFFDELFRFGTSSSPSLEERMKGTPCRVLTFNYDRLFERTFIEWAKREEPDNGEIGNDLRTFLNMGLGDPIEIEPERFSLLKLHGGIGQFNRPGGSDHHNQ